MAGPKVLAKFSSKYGEKLAKTVLYGAKSEVPREVIKDVNNRSQFFATQRAANGALRYKPKKSTVMQKDHRFVVASSGFDSRILRAIGYK